MATVFSVDQCYVEYDFLLFWSVSCHLRFSIILNKFFHSIFLFKFLLLQRPMKRDRTRGAYTACYNSIAQRSVFASSIFCLLIKAIYSFFIDAWSGILMSVPKNKKKKNIVMFYVCVQLNASDTSRTLYIQMLSSRILRANV